MSCLQFDVASRRTLIRAGGCPVRNSRSEGKVLIGMRTSDCLRIEVTASRMLRPPVERQPDCAISRTHTAEKPAASKAKAGRSGSRPAPAKAKAKTPNAMPITAAGSASRRARMTALRRHSDPSATAQPAQRTVHGADNIQTQPGHRTNGFKPLRLECAANCGDADNQAAGPSLFGLPGSRSGKPVSASHAGRRS